MAAIVISPVNRKGGVGKSSSVFHLAGHFALHGQRVLLIDNEPQHSLTNGLIGPTAADHIAPEESTAALFLSEQLPTPEQVIQSTNLQGIDLLPGSDALDAINGPIEQHPAETQLAVKRFVETVANNYDLILIDNPPNLQLCTYSSLAASNVAYCIVKPQEYDVQGLVPVQKALDRVLTTTNPKLRFSGYILNMVQARRSLHQAYEERLRKRYGEKVFATTVPDWNDFAESLSARQPVSFYRRSSPAAQVMGQLAGELAARIQQSFRQTPMLQFRPQHRTEEVA